MRPKENEGLFTDIQRYLNETRRENDATVRTRMIDFAARSEGIIALLPSDNLNSHYFEHVTVWQRRVDEATTRTSMGLYRSRFPKLQVERIELHHHEIEDGKTPKNTVLDIAPHIELNRMNQLYIGTHMDEETRKQAQDLLESDNIKEGSLFSIFMFDRDGNFEKITALPRLIIDQREEVQSGDVSTKYISSPITSRDLELIEYSLLQLEAQVQKELQ